MKNRPYYSARTGSSQNGMQIDLPILRRFVESTYSKYVRNGYFQESLGYECVDTGVIPGYMGEDVELYALVRLKKPSIFPFDRSHNYTEADLFDLIEFMFDHISKPIDGFHHDWYNCGWHYSTFDKQAGQVEFREEVNPVLRDYGNGWELDNKGEILLTGESGLNLLFDAQIPGNHRDGLHDRVQAAIIKFRRHKSSVDNRRDAVRDLADVLELLRPKLKQVLNSQDESDLFNIANNFGIRHNNENQKRGYDHDIWLSWMFYYYLSTIHASMHLIERRAIGIDRE